ncbi:uncharacterized protein [Palaemon carinicauda]|uniref:uncharacterized protein n=1 Tax=Palaemon carinicauda TaxID=392227 RepID=UPI0035B67EC2
MKITKGCSASLGVEIMLLKLLVMLNLYAVADANELRRSPNDGSLFVAGLVDKEMIGNHQKGLNNAMIEPRIGDVDRSIPRPINDLFVAEEMPGNHQKGDVDRNGTVEEQDGFIRNTNGKDGAQRKFGNVVKSEEFLGDDGGSKFEKMSLLGVERDAGKEDKTPEPGFSIIDTDSRTYNQQLPKEEVEQEGMVGTAGGQKQRFNQKKMRKHEGSFPHGQERFVSVNKKSSRSFQSKEALSGDKVFPLRENGGGKVGEMLINPNTPSENSSTEDVIKDSLQKNTDGSTEGRVLKGTRFNQPGPLASPQEISSKDVGRQEVRTSHYLSNVRWKYRKHNHVHKFSRKENEGNRTISSTARRTSKLSRKENKGNKTISSTTRRTNKFPRKENEGNRTISSTTLRTNKFPSKENEYNRTISPTAHRTTEETLPSETKGSRGRRNLDDKMTKDTTKNVHDQLKTGVNLSQPHNNTAQEGRDISHAGLYPHNPEERLPFYDYNAREENDEYYDPDDYWEESSHSHYYGGDNRMITMDDMTMPGQNGDSTCGCLVTDPPHPEVECTCSGPNVRYIPANLSAEVFRITVMNAPLETLRNDSFTRYRSTLRDIVLHNVQDFHKIEAGCFSGLVQLRSIYIYSAPKLKFIRNLTFTEDKLRSLRIVSSGLEAVPNLRFSSNEILHMIDLSETSITALPTAGLKELEVLRLENTPSLKVFPSVYSFKTIKEAHLTYPYHCCAFQFPDQHKKEQYVSHQKIQEKMEQGHCGELTSPTSPAMTQTTRVRQRRYAPVPPISVMPTVEGSITSLSSGRLEPGKQMNYQGFSSPEEEEWGPVQPEALTGRKKYISSRIQLKNWKHLPKSSYPVNSVQWFQAIRSSSLNSIENSDSKKVILTSKRFKRNGKYLRVNEPSPRHRRSRPDINTTIPEAEKSNRVDHDIKNNYLVPLRHQMKQKYEPSRLSHTNKHARLSRRELFHESKSSFGNDFKLKDSMEILPVLNKKSEAKTPEVGDPLSKETFDPILDKNFGSDEIPGHPGGNLDDNLAEGGAAGPGGFQNYFLGFGPFNHSADRYPMDAFKPNDTFVGVWGNPEAWPDHGDNTEPFGFHEEGLIDEGGFVGKEIFSEEDQTTILKNEEDKWHVPRAPMNNTTILVLCGKLSKNYHDVMCVPAPDAFNPCEDIMGNIALRVAVWFVVVTAVVGNLAVMLVLVSSKFRMTVSKFLMVNLALADLSMGIYLLIIASMDLHTIGVYFNYAIDWQNGPGCKVAGFLTVFASELSIFTLTIITSERWYAITYAIHLNKRLKLSMAAKIMVIGWIYSITMATLPLVGISGYSKTSICLPMETGNGLALTYLISLLLVNGLAFIVITACYASMYCSISRHDASASHSDLTVAKRMALLVFTDFACWAPIAFFGLTAVAGIPLINVTRAKILLVFFYPLNSCANPYLYAILTKQYRRDLFILLARYGFCTKKAMRYKGAYSSVNNTFPHNTVVNAGPNHRNSTLTQITLCDLTRVARTSQQSNSGSLPGTAIGGSQDSLQKNVSPSRTPTKPEMCAGDSERLSTVQEMSHSNHSDDDTSEYCQQQLQLRQQEEVTHSNTVRQTGSPHPLKNCYARLSITPQQEQVLKYALNESKAKKNAKSTNVERDIATEKMDEKRGRDGSQSPSQGETIVMYEVEIYKESSPKEDNTLSKTLEEVEATSAV